MLKVCRHIPLEAQRLIRCVTMVWQHCDDHIRVLIRDDLSAGTSLR